MTFSVGRSGLANMRWFLLLLVLITWTAQSQEQTPSKQQSQYPAQEATKKPIGTEKPPLAITVKPAESNYKKAETRETDRQEKADSDVDLVYWTRVLALLAFLQFAALVGHAVIFRSQSKALGDTVQAMRDEFISTNRPVLRVKHVWLTGDVWGQKEVAVNVAVVNVGITTARVREYSATTLIQMAEDDLPVIPDYKYKQIGGSESLIKSGFTMVFPPITEERRILSHEDNAAIRNGTRLLYCYGYVEYEDMKGGIRKTAFIRTLKPPAGVGSFSKNGRFEKYSDEDYEYQD